MQKNRQASVEIEMHWKAEKRQGDLSHPAFLKSIDPVRT
jgi:hypothetical protein